MIGMANMLGNSQTGEMGDPVYDAFYASQVQFQNNTVKELPMPKFAYKLAHTI